MGANVKITDHGQINKAIADCRNVYDPNYRAVSSGAGADQAQSKTEQKFFNRTDAGNAENVSC